MPKINTDHVVVACSNLTDGAFRCNHCGATLPYELPMSVDAWVKMSRRFTNEHKNCKPTETITELEMKHGREKI